MTTDAVYMTHIIFKCPWSMYLFQNENQTTVISYALIWMTELFPILGSIEQDFLY